mgnify:CR=1 FL=1
MKNNGKDKENGNDPSEVVSYSRRTQSSASNISHTKNAAQLLARQLDDLAVLKERSDESY